jgi:hypothetical protein
MHLGERSLTRKSTTATNIDSGRLLLTPVVVNVSRDASVAAAFTGSSEQWYFLNATFPYGPNYSAFSRSLAKLPRKETRRIVELIRSYSTELSKTVASVISGDWACNGVSLIGFFVVEAFALWSLFFLIPLIPGGNDSTHTARLTFAGLQHSHLYSAYG